MPFQRRSTIIALFCFGITPFLVAAAPTYLTDAYNSDARANKICGNKKLSPCVCGDNGQPTIGLRDGNIVTRCTARSLAYVFEDPTDKTSANTGKMKTLTVRLAVVIYSGWLILHLKSGIPDFRKKNPSRLACGKSKLDQPTRSCR
jgi:hypothetical protein